MLEVDTNRVFGNVVRERRYIAWNFASIATPWSDDHECGRPVTPGRSPSGRELRDSLIAL